MSENAAEKRTQVIVVERSEDCGCEEVFLHPNGEEYWLSTYRMVEGHAKCPHGSVVRRLRAGDIPVGLAAAAIGLSEEG
jgi:hypothetical protein